MDLACLCPKWKYASVSRSIVLDQVVERDSHLRLETDVLTVGVRVDLEDLLDDVEHRLGLLFGHTFEANPQVVQLHDLDVTTEG